jgi:hypothetical protein
MNLLLVKGNIGQLKGESASKIHRINISSLAASQIWKNLESACQHERKFDEVNGISVLVLRRALASAHLLCLQILIEKVKSGLVGLRGAHDCEHTLSGFVMR